MGTNPRDPSSDNCADAAVLLMTYIILNFVYNIMMLSITKKGSAVLLVTSQALSLPITNIAFTLKPLMGDNAEPLSMTDLAGLVLVCIGFVAYSGFGFAKNFMVAQGPPGQMAYAHFEDHDEVVISTKIVLEPEKLADFIVGGIIREHMLVQAQKYTSSSDALQLLETGHKGSSDDEGDSSDRSRLLDHATGLRKRSIQQITPLEACTTALDVLRKATELVEKHEKQLRADESYMTSPAMLNRLDTLARNHNGNRNGNDVKPKGYGTIRSAEC